MSIFAIALLSLTTLAAPAPNPAAEPAPAPAGEAGATLVEPAASPANPSSQPAAWSIDWRLFAGAGAISGLGTRVDSGGLLLVDGALTPAWNSGRLEVALPLRLASRITPGASLPETRARAAVEPVWKATPILEMGAELGVGNTWRLGWEDQYQRTAAGVMSPTDRYSYLAWLAGARLYLQPWAHQHLRLRYRFEDVSYVRDPAFDPAKPQHLTPRDQIQHELNLSWRYVRRSYAVALRLQTAFRRDSVYLARRAGTGGSSGNPFQELNDFEPSLEVEWRRLLRGALDLSARLGYEIQQDLFQGYYSYTGLHPRVQADWTVRPGLTAAASVEAWRRLYGPNSKAATEDLARLYAHRLRVAGELAYQLRSNLWLRGEASWLTNDTNYPDYVPGVYPAPPRAPDGYYDIKQDYDNLRAVIGVEWRG